MNPSALLEMKVGSGRDCQPTHRFCLPHTPKRKELLSVYWLNILWIYLRITHDEQTMPHGFELYEDKQLAVRGSSSDIEYRVIYVTSRTPVRPGQD
ncbi:hypothetical protein AG1IA_05752 [Rhizoctonia solani AG-1 IA]|uniref:Uncharacterized protein n=1 Tax=Thanatephorus cucumeris (strain AG1-IA) TaxID=983506 RepID=L8WQC3_THACA|nr:hypothetical protein AG1IA_05752 [Rhizoctonia solani AG-1 IA]